MRNQVKLLFVPAALLLTTGCVKDSPSYDECIVGQTYVHRYGVEVPEESWSESGQCGKVITKLGSGINVTTCYQEGTIDGEATYSFPHSEAIQKTESYSQGYKSKELINYTSGMPMKETIFISPTEERVTWWYENSIPRAVESYQEGALTQGEYYNYSHQLEANIANGNGTRVSRDPYGLLVSTDKFENGWQVSSMVYYPNGAPKESIPYVHGVVQGEKRTFLPGGEPNTSEQWSNGKQQGLTTVYQNGEKYAEVNYQNGQKEGVEKRYRDGTTLEEELTWRAGLQHGPSASYVSGTKTTSWYYQGRPTNKAVFDRLTSAR
jgi:antitoxin component YwqK of YwqJK toxin-antitoxin module